MTTGPHHEEAVVVHVGLDLSSKLLLFRGRRRRLRGGAGPQLLLLALPVLSYPLQHQLPLLDHQDKGLSRTCSRSTQTETLQSLPTFIFCRFSARASWVARCLSCSSNSPLSCLMRDSTGDRSEDGLHDCAGLRTNEEGSAERHNGSCSSNQAFTAATAGTALVVNTSVCVRGARRVPRRVERGERCLGWLRRPLGQRVARILTLQEPDEGRGSRLTDEEQGPWASVQGDSPLRCICNRKMACLYSCLDLLLCEPHFPKDEE